MSAADRNARYKAAHPEKVRASKAAYRASHRDNLKSYDQGRREARRPTVQKLASPFPSPGLSEELRDAMSAAADVYVFQSAEHTLKWARGLPAGLLDEILASGIAACLSRARALVRLGSVTTQEIERQRERGRLFTDGIRTKAKTLDRLVEMLDLKDVNGKPLGDCTKFDLLREAARLEAEAKELTLDAALYRQLAAIVGNQTVRQASNRGQIVALLQQRSAA